MRVALRVSVLTIVASVGTLELGLGDVRAAERNERAASRRAGAGSAIPSGELVVEREDADTAAERGRGWAAKRATLAQKRRESSRALSEALDGPHGVTLSSRPAPPREFAYGSPGYKASPVYTTPDAIDVATDSRLRHAPSPSSLSNTSRRSALANPPQVTDRTEITAAAEPSLVPAPGSAKPIAPRASNQRNNLR